MLRAWAQLLRIPNVFTAPPDVIAGAVLALGGWPEREQVSHLIQLCLASGCLYSAGMVLNDVFDLHEDRRDRPHRPLPSGRISRATAAAVGCGLLLIGVTLGGLASNGSMSGWTIPLGLAGLIVLYNAWAKRTMLGPFVMGACRGMNVLLGGLALSSWPPSTIWAIVTVTLYISGVTLFARSEAKMSERRTLLGGVVLMAAAFGSLVTMLHSSLTLDGRVLGFYFLTIIWATIILRPILTAITSPNASEVQKAVKTCIFGLVMLEAIHACIAVGPSGLLLLLFLLPAVLLGKWVYST